METDEKARKENERESLETFYLAQLEEIGLQGKDDPANFIEVIDPEIEPPAPKNVRVRIFEEDPKGMRINYASLDGQFLTSYTDAKNPRPVRFHQVRQIRGDKYLSPKGMPAYPFVIPLIDRYRQREKTPTLFLTEGAKKAFKATRSGILTAGLTSVFTYKDRETGRLHSDIEKFIAECEVENVVFLVDADCWNISEKVLAAGGDIAHRPRDFYSAAKTVRELALQINRADGKPLDVFFYAVNAESLGGPKGLDDLLRAAEEAGRLDEVVHDALNLAGRNSPFFLKRNITSSMTKLHHDFALHNVQEFYFRHRELIEGRRFCWFGDRYEWDEASDSLKMIRPGWAENIFFVDNDFWEICPTVKTRKGKGSATETYSTEDLRLRSKAALKLKYGDKFWKYLDPKVDYFDSFCCVPDNLNYQRRIFNSFNRYSPVPYTPEEGTCDLTVNFIKHIFGHEKKEHDGISFEMWEIGLDYLSILLKHPMQALPIVILYSPENNTGKTTFANLLFAIFGDNVLDVNDNDLRSEFNEQFAGKLIAICQETLLNKKEDAEKLKALSTKPIISINPKGKAKYTLDFFTKFQLYSNNKKMIYVTEEDDRYWMLRVPVPEKPDPDLERRMKAEIPAFLHFLINRKIKAPYDSRMWFHKSLYRTSLFDEVVSANEPSDMRHLREQLEEVFALLNAPGDYDGKSIPIPSSVNEDDLPRDQILMPLKDIAAVYFKDSIKAGWLRDILEQMGVEKYEGGKTKSGKYPVIRTSGIGTSKNGHSPGLFPEDVKKDEDESILQWHRFNGRPYVFKKAIFFPEKSEA